MKLNSSLQFILLMIIIGCGSALPAQTHQDENLSLDGSWEIIFDRLNEGRSAEWFFNENFDKQKGIRMISVPSSWELMEMDYEGVVFYRHKFEIPSHWKDKVIRLKFGAVNYICEVWINEKVVGFHEGGFTPFEFRVDNMLRAGESNILTLRVVGPLILSDREIDGMGPLETPQWRGGISGGVWQSISLQATGASYVNDVFIQTDILENTAKFKVALDHTAIYSTPVNIAIRILNDNGSPEAVCSEDFSWKLHPGKNEQSFAFTIPDAEYWSPDNPKLYIAELIISDDKGISDRWSSRFGLRELSIKEKDFYLNGKAIYIKAAFFEGLYPKGIAFPDTKEMVIGEIMLAKEAGFNMIRPWRHPPAPMWLDMADSLGVMVVGSPVLECMRLPLSTPYLPFRVENEISQVVLRDRNRTCVVQWELFNELHRPVLKQMMRPMAMLTRELDPTRLILDESGGWAYGANMYLPYATEATKFNDIHTYPGPFINKRLFDGFLAVGKTEDEKKEKRLHSPAPGRNVVPGLMSFISELGYGSLPDLLDNNERFKLDGNPLTPAYRYHERLHQEQKQMLKESGFDNLYPDIRQFYLDQQAIHGEANKRMIEAARSNPEVDGYCIHALTAGDWILGAGLLDIWRNPKSHAYEETRAANQPRILVIRTNPRNIYAQHGLELEVTGINELEKTEGRLEIEILSERGDPVYKKEIEVEWKQGVSNLLDEKIRTTELRGTCTVRVVLRTIEENALAENSRIFHVFGEEDLLRPEGEIALLDFSGKLTKFLSESGFELSQFSSSTHPSVPVLVAGYNSKKLPEGEKFAALFDFVERGGSVIFAEEMNEGFLGEDTGMPFSARVHRAKGLWTCIPHLVGEHPIFEGLPDNSMMRDLYENIWALNTLRNLEGEQIKGINTVVGTVGYDWFSDNHKMHYSGPGSSWWGSDLAVLSLGKGHLILSQLRLVNMLGVDPVADKILFNMLHYASQL